MAPSRPSQPPPPRRAFTLTELLIVVALIVILATIGVPAFRAMTGGRSIDSAENVLSAAFAQAREDALALQEPRGIFLFTDPDSGRVAVAEVYFDPNDVGRIIPLPDRDQLLLPIGIGGQMLDNGGGNLAAGVILFDGFGRLSVQNYQLGKVWTDAPTTPPPTPPLQNGRGIVLPPGYPTGSIASQVGFSLYDQEGYNAVKDAGPAGVMTFFQDNATPFLVNRYNGTLLRAGE